MKNKFNYLFAFLLTLFIVCCKKESIKNDNNLSNEISSNAKEYVYFEIEGLDSLSKFVFQDVEGYAFTGYHDRCPISPTYVLHEIQKPSDPYNNPRFSIYLGTASQPSKFKDGVKIKKYSVLNLNDGNAAVSFCHPSVNKGGLCASTMNGTNGNLFEITSIVVEDGKEYALGTFEIYAHTPSPGNTEYFWLKKGVFRIKI